MKITADTGRRTYEVLVERRDGEYVVKIDGSRHAVDARKLEGDFYSILSDGRSYEVSVESKDDGYQVRHGAATLSVRLSDPARRALEGRAVGAGAERIVSPMPGKVVRLLVSEGEEVREGQGVVVVEAMKMENEITAGRDGKVTSVAVETGQRVESGALLLVIEQGSPAPEPGQDRAR